ADVTSSHNIQATFGSTSATVSSVPAMDWMGYLIAAFLMSLFALRGFRGKGRGLLMIAFLFCAMATPAGTAHAAAGPGWFNMQGTLVSPQDADAYYRTAPAPQGFITPLSGTTTTPEITALARALQNNPTLIYEYVRNNVDYVPYFGSLKGATLTYLDGSGNDFDQASLMIALLEAAGYTAQYVYGTMQIPASGDPNQMDMQHWLSVDNNNTVISQVLANGAIPASLSGNTWTVTRVWVQATISGSTYLFDPAFKPYQTVSGINLQSVMGYSQNSLLSSAGGTLGTNYIQNMNESGLDSTMNVYAMSLANYIKTNMPNAQTEDIIGGRYITPQYLSALPTTLPLSNTPQYTWTNIPSTYIHTVQIQHGQINQTFNIPDLAGKKLAITYTPGTITTLSDAAPIQIPLSNTPTVIPIDPLPNLVAPPSPSIDGGTDGIQPMSTNEGTIPFPSIYPPSVQFGTVSETMSGLTNNNPVTFEVVVSLPSNPQGAFSITAGGGNNYLAPNGGNMSITIQLSNAGQSPGTKTGQLEIQWIYNGTIYGDYTYNLTGYVGNPPNTSGSYGTNLGSTNLGYPINGTVGLTNSGSLPMTITGISLTGTNANQFQITGGGTLDTLASGQNQAISVSYLANSVGASSANVYVTYTYDTVNYGLNIQVSGTTVATPVAQLTLDDTIRAQETQPITVPNPNNMTITVTHPYSTTFANQSVTYTLVRGSGSTYAIIYDFGGSRLGRLLEKRERQLQTYRASGYADTSTQVLTETLNVMGATWMRNTTMNDNLLGQIQGVIDVHHHRFGIVAQESGYYIDVRAQMHAPTSVHGDNAAS